MAIGFHVSIAGGVCSSIERTVELGCDAMQIFAANPRGWAFAPRTEEETRHFRELRAEAGIGVLAVHTTYLINLASPDPVVFKKSVELFGKLLCEARALGAEFLVTHLGSPRKRDAEYAARRVVEALGRACGPRRKRRGHDTLILLENTSGAGTGFGGSIEEIGAVMDAALEIGIETGLCFDTCHAFAAGYRMSDAGDAEETVAAIDAGVGLERLGLVHLNDSKGECAGRLDRHEHIGRGRIGMKGLRAFLSRPGIKGVPIILETPQDADGDEQSNLKAARRLLG